MTKFDESERGSRKLRATYCRRWNFLRSGPIDELPPSEARRLNDNGDIYAVSLGDPVDPDVVIEVAWKNHHIGVWFFDQEKRRSVQYAFSGPNNEGLMFLEEMTRWQYPDSSVRNLSDAELIEKIRYQRDGIVRQEVRDNRTHERQITDRHSVDVSLNWESAPKFGQWASITRFDRTPPPAK